MHRKRTFLKISIVFIVFLLTLFACAVMYYLNSVAQVKEAEIVRVIDGDTLVCNVEGKTEKVRLLGVDCPESVNPDANKNSFEGYIASAYTKEHVEVGQIVWLEKDWWQKNEDKYGRLLRYVWLCKPAIQPVEFFVELLSPNKAENTLNYQLISSGNAKYYFYDNEQAKYKNELQKAQNVSERGY